MAIKPAFVGICGELGADLTLTETFLRMGVDELSVSPPSVLPLREKFALWISVNNLSKRCFFGSSAFFDILA